MTAENEAMKDKEFRCFLDLMMCSDPWPVPNDENRSVLKAMADRMATERGFTDWIDAYHNMDEDGWRI